MIIGRRVFDKVVNVSLALIRGQGWTVAHNWGKRLLYQLAVGWIDRAAEGYLQITHRTKDLIKSGGEWISSVDLESLLMAHPKVLEACVIAVRHPKWAERPLACVVPRPEHPGAITSDELLEFLEPKVAKWWLPDQVVSIESVPKTSVGKFDKKVLRKQFKEWKPKE